MTTILTYILKWALGLAALYLPFALLLRKETFATLNRRLLLCIIIASALLPCIIVSYPVKIEQPTIVPVTAVIHETPATGSTQSETGKSTGSAIAASHDTGAKKIITPRNIFISYSVGVIVSALLFTTSLIRAMRRVRRGAIWVDRQKRMTVYCHAGNTAPFSLFRNVVISQSDYDECGKEILLHEEGHIRHGHSYDMLLISIVKSLQWFNPFIYLLANDIKEIHEYEADRYVLQHNGNKQAYQMLILKKAVGNIPFPLANSFSQSCVRKRIKMMARKESNSGKRCKWLYLLPVSAAYIGAFAQPEYIYITAPKAAEAGTTQQQQPIESEDTAVQPTICLPVAGKATIAYEKTLPRRLPKEIARIELPVIEEEQLFTDNYCEYIDLENSIAAETLRASGIRKCDIKVNFTTGKDGKPGNMSIASCNVTAPGSTTPADIEQIKATATAATIEYIAGKQWYTGQKTRYDAHIIYHYGPSMEIAGNNSSLPLMAGATAIR